MPAVPPSLDELRQQIDRVDDALHDLLMQRTEIVRAIGLTKGTGQPMLRPAREAQILRRLAARHQGSLPLPVLVRMWRELIAGLTWMQGAFAVAVYVPPERKGFWDLARDHFGSYAPMTMVNSPVAAVRAVTEGNATIAVVPLPAEDEADPWWRFLNAHDPKAPRVAARLPFLVRGASRAEDGEALVVGLLVHEPSGDDRTLLRIELGEDLSRGRIKDTLEASRLVPTAFCSWQRRGGPVHLVEVADYVGAGDPRLVAAAERIAALGGSILSAGGYAMPLVLTGDARRS